jgi:hypothetical protein
MMTFSVGALYNLKIDFLSICTYSKGNGLDCLIVLRKKNWHFEDLFFYVYDDF